MKNTNRYEKELKGWEEKERRLSGLFTPSILQSTAFAEEKLRHYERLLRQPKAFNNLEERLTRKMILQEKKAIERKLYPSLIIRLVRRGAVRSAAAVKQYLARQWQPRMSQHIRVPLEGESSAAIRQLIQQSKVALQKPVQKPGQSPVVAELSAEQHKRMSQGHVVHHDGKWQQYDLNDKDAGGNYRIRSAQLPDRDLLDQLGNLPLSRPIDLPATLEAMKSGQSPVIYIRGAGKELVVTPSVNVRLGKLDLLDGQSGKVSLKSMLGKQAVAHKGQSTSRQEQASKNRKRGVAQS